MTKERRGLVMYAAYALFLWPLVVAGSWPWSLADKVGLILLAAANAWVVMRAVVAVKA